MAGPVSATEVADIFVKKYYHVLSTKPDEIRKFYKAHSVFSFSRCSGGHGAPGASMPISAVGQDKIQEGIMTTLNPFGPHGCRAEILGMDSQESRWGGVLILVTGCLSMATADGTDIKQHFTQSFFLDKQRHPYEGYFVLNDILRYTRPAEAPQQAFLGGLAPPPMGPPQPQWPQPVPVSGAFLPHGGLPMAAVSAPPHSPSPVAKAVPADEAALASAMPASTPEDDDEQDQLRTRPQVLHEELAVAMEEQGKNLDEDEADEHVAEVSLDIEEEEEEELPEDAKETSGDEAAVGEEAASPKADGAFAPASGEEQDDLDYNGLEGWEVPPEEQPKTWASMAGRLNSQGGGKLGPSKVQGFVVPAESENIWVWLSRLPSEPVADSQEVLNGLNSCLMELSCNGRAVEVDRRDPTQDWASVCMTSQEAADTLVTLSKDRHLMLRGKLLKAEPHRMGFGGIGRYAHSGGRGGRGIGGSRGGGAGGDDDRRRELRGEGRGDGRGGGTRPKRRPRGGGIGIAEGRERQ
mmetsp:Transcript_54183/g.117058  ORF Transcript_54183/g.117058 Transcript_54183/m.117058 type:complete len:522 (+) Transcript_54183:26-1591(+)